MRSIFEFIQQQRNNYRSETIEIAEGCDYSQYQTLRTIELYHNSKFITSNKDNLGREKLLRHLVAPTVNTLSI